ncbi:hypothetical protein QJS04_geneDACA018093 [Acorus gramineus]|uniref:Phytocyanin domain-containing protein n=1 Tax=Acorus gramineus TaxID=55184 RepID=A0AAV9A7K2_ACOGR|nr:hypothetical protein QJS04_geneDACA018093 [Acorus gramineus]
MANTTVMGSSLLWLLVLAPMAASALQFKVGGSMGWTVPSDPNSFNDWAGKNRFKIGDTLLFVYDPAKDSVLQVTQPDYDSCNVASPVATLPKSGNTVFTINHSGRLFFISGSRDNCVKNEKMTVVILSDRSSNSSSPSPASAPTTTTTASPPPTTTAASPPSPPPPPMASSPPPAGEKTPPPSSSPKHNGGSSMVVGFLASFGAVLGSSVVLVL